MKKSKSFSRYSLSNIGQVDVEPALSARDQRVPRRVALAQKVAGDIKAGLREELGVRTDHVDKEKPLILKVRTVRCTKGSRWARVFGGEFGMGWALLFLEWYIIDSSSGEIILGASTEQFSHAGSLGLGDIRESGIGKKAVNEMALLQGIPTIVMKVEASFQENEASSKGDVQPQSGDSEPRIDDGCLKPEIHDLNC